MDAPCITTIGIVVIAAVQCQRRHCHRLSLGIHGLTKTTNVVVTTVHSIEGVIHSLYAFFGCHR